MMYSALLRVYQDYVALAYFLLGLTYLGVHVQRSRPSVEWNCHMPTGPEHDDSQVSKYSIVLAVLFATPTAQSGQGGGGQVQ
jgi:hypothetical protein